jgi:hypothetical protein
LTPTTVGLKILLIAPNPNFGTGRDTPVEYPFSGFMNRRRP